MSGASGGAAFAYAVAQSTKPGFDILLLLHVLCALAGLATIIVSGVQAARVRSLALANVPVGPEVGAGSEASALDVEAVPPPLRRYFSPGTNWAARVVYGVPIFGFALIGVSDGSYGLQDSWIMVGLALWVVAIGVGEGVLWPGERRIQRILSDPQPSDARSRGRPTRIELARAGSVVMLAAAGMLVVLLIAIVVMFVRP